MNNTFKSKTSSTFFSNQHKSFRTTMSALPSLFHPKGSVNIPNAELKEKILHLKRELNKLIFEYQELKLAHSKLEIEKEINKKLFNEAITETKETARPCIELTRSNSASEMKISFESFSKLKEANMISSMKHQISVLQKMIKQKDEEIEDLKSDSKVNKLIEKNKQLVDLMNKTSQLAKGVPELELLLAEKKNQTKEDMSNRDYYKALNTTLKCENEMLIEKNGLLQSALDLRNKKVSIHQEHANNLKYKYNTTKQIEKTKHNELVFQKEQLSNETDVKKNKEKITEENKKNAKIIQQLKEEIEAKGKRIKSIEVKNCDLVQQVSKKMTEMKKYRINENNQIDSLKKEIIRLEREFSELRNKKESTMKENKKIEEVQRWKENSENRIQEVNEMCSIYRQIQFDIIINNNNVKKRPKLSLRVDSFVDTNENPNSNSILFSSNTTSIPNFQNKNEINGS